MIDWIRRTKEVSGFDLAPLVEAWRRSRVAASGVLRPGFAARRRGGREDGCGRGDGRGGA